MMKDGIFQMQEQGVMERAFLLLAFYNVPKGFLHRNVVPISKKDKNNKILFDSTSFK